MTTTRLWIAAVLLFIAPAWGQTATGTAPAQQPASQLQFEVSFPSSASQQPITGRVFVILASSDQPEPRLQVGMWTAHVPFFGSDVDQLKSAEPAVINPETLGFPFKSLRDLQAGDYYVQALLNVYTEFHRSDGHTIWAHMDHWEGQQFNVSPGNLYSDTQKVHLDPASGYDVKLSLTHVIPPVQVPPDTDQVKRVKIQSKMLTKFWGQPIFLGASVLLPKGYKEHPNVRYPVIYIQDHFKLDPPFGFSESPKAEDPWLVDWISRNNTGPYIGGYDFARQWNSADFPRMIAVLFQHPTPYFDDSYAVNSANNGPYGDALLTELMPELEGRFRTSRKPYQRVLTGGSTGGWESLALQLYHPDVFGGTWTLYPDPIDFTRYQLVDIYHDDNAFLAAGYTPPIPERPMER